MVVIINKVKFETIKKLMTAKKSELNIKIKEKIDSYL